MVQISWQQRTKTSTIWRIIGQPGQIIAPSKAHDVENSVYGVGNLKVRTRYLERTHKRDATRQSLKVLGDILRCGCIIATRNERRLDRRSYLSHSMMVLKLEDHRTLRVWQSLWLQSQVRKGPPSAESGVILSNVSSNQGRTQPKSKGQQQQQQQQKEASRSSSSRDGDDDAEKPFLAFGWVLIFCVFFYIC